MAILIFQIIYKIGPIYYQIKDLKQTYKFAYKYELYRGFRMQHRIQMPKVLGSYQADWFHCRPQEIYQAPSHFL